MINGTKVFFTVWIGLTILAFELANLAKPVGVLCFECGGTHLIEFFERPAKSSDIVETVLHRDGSRRVGLVKQV